MKRLTPIVGLVALLVVFICCLRLVPHSTDSMQVCGLGTVYLNGSHEAESNFLTSIAGTARARWLKALNDSASPRAQAARLAMLSVDNKLSTDGMEKARNEIALLAANSADPAVYGLALDICRSEDGKAPPCEGLSWDRWAKLEPDNGAPWLKRAAVAHEQSDAAAEAEAFQGVSHARTVEFYSRKVLMFAEPYVPVDVSPLQRRVIFTEAMILTVPSGWPYLEIARLCSSERIEQVDTKSGCDAIAEMLIAQGGDLADLEFGRRLARQLNWPQEKLIRIDTHAEALLAATIYGDKDFTATWLSCPEVAAFDVWTREVAELGFFGAANAKLRRSGFTEAQLAAKWRARVEEWRHEGRAAEANSDSECRR